MKYLTFFVVFWTIIALAWRAADVQVKATKYFSALEQLILAPITVIGWIKIGVSTLMDRMK